MSIDHFLNWGWDPSATKPSQLRRVRTLVSACLLLIMVGIPFVLRAIQWELPTRIAFISLAMGSGVLALVLLRWRHFTPAVHCMALGVYLAGLNQYLTVGGLASGAVAWWLLVPLIGGLLKGLRTGLFWVAITLLSSLVLFYLETQGHSFPNLTPPGSRNAQSVVQLLGEFFAVVILMVAYLTQIETSERSLAQKNASLQEQVLRAEVAEAEALKASAAKTRFLANMTHELRTPLNSILGFSRRLLNQLDQQLDERQRGGLQLVVGNGDQMLRLVSDLLELSRLETDALELGRSPVDLQETIALLLPDLEQRCQQFGLSLMLESNAEALTYGDVSRLKYACSIVLLHAAQYCPTGNLRVSAVVSDSEAPGGQWQLTVDCEQLFFTEEQRQRIFDRYDHLHSLSGRVDQVSGLGMVLAREMLRLHGGEVAVEPYGSTGTRYRLVLPLLLRE